MRYDHCCHVSTVRLIEDKDFLKKDLNIVYLRKFIGQSIVKSHPMLFHPIVKNVVKKIRPIKYLLMLLSNTVVDIRISDLEKFRIKHKTNANYSN